MKFIFLVLITFISNPQYASACGCANEADAASLFNLSKTVFQIEIVGNELTSVATNQGVSRAVEFKYEIVESYKEGSLKIPLFQMFDSCSLNLKTGNKYVVFVPKNAWRGVENAIHMCSGTLPVVTEGMFAKRVDEIKKFSREKQ